MSLIEFLTLSAHLERTDFVPGYNRQTPVGETDPLRFDNCGLRILIHRQSVSQSAATPLE